MTQDSLVVLITGTSSGFGLRTAQTLAKRGHHVFASMRGVDRKNVETAETMRKWAATENAHLEVVELDITDQATIDKAIQDVLASAGRIDVVVNNAGSATAGLLEAFSLDDRLQEPAYPSNVRLELNITDVDDDNLEDQILRIVTEALSNALRHSGGNNIDVNVEAGSDGVLIRVADDGIGFDTRRPTTGMGLANIAARAERIGGALTLRSQPGDGSVVEVVAPSK